MIKFVLGMLVTGITVGCAMEEPDTSGTLTVDTNRKVNIPEWLSIEDVDHNRDGIINVRDLVLVAHFFGQEVAADKKVATIKTIELGTKKVGELFRIRGEEKLYRLEAHNSDGKVEEALASWQRHTGADIFAVKGSGINAGLFLTETALTKEVTELIGFDYNDNKVLKANVNIEAREDNISLTFAFYLSGGTPDHTLIAFKRTPDPFLPDDNFYTKVVQEIGYTQNGYLVFDANMQVHNYHTGVLDAAGTDGGRGIWVGIGASRGFKCIVGEKVMARVESTIYTGTCLPDVDG